MIRNKIRLTRWVLLAGSIALGSAQAQPVIALIIDDLGYRYADSRRATELPGPVACAVIPHTPHAKQMAQAAHANGKEVLLHLPMQPVNPARSAGENGIDLDTSRRGVASALEKGMESVPHVSGVNNHMGSLITRHPGHMTWLMRNLRDRALFFVDSVTTESSVALRMAREQGVVSTRRDLFLDTETSTEAEIGARFRALVALARRQGQALGIAHPFPATMTLLERELPRLEGVQLVSVRELISLRESTSEEKVLAAGGTRRYSISQ